MKTALKILGGIIGTLALAVAVFWFGWLSPPAADDVCNNVGRILEEDSGIAFPAKLREECMQRATKAPEFGRAIWVKQLKCMRDASNKSQLVECDKVKEL
jgi:hypothetical protein